MGNGDSLDPIMTDNLPAPMALIELSMCSCKGGCKSRRCKCLKYTTWFVRTCASVKIAKMMDLINPMINSILMIPKSKIYVKIR